MSTRYMKKLYEGGVSFEEDNESENDVENFIIGHVKSETFKSFEYYKFFCAEPSIYRKLLLFTRFSMLYLASPYLPKESQEAYYKCITTEAFFKSAIPTGFALGYMTYKAYSRFTTVSPLLRNVAVAFAGITGFMCGKALYRVKCIKTYAPTVFENPRDIYREKRNGENMLLTSKDTQEDYDINFADNSNQLDDTNKDSEEMLATDKPSTIAKQHITYEDLRKQNRLEYYKRRQSYNSNSLKNMNKPKRDPELLEDTTFESESKEDDLWSLK